MGPGLSLQLGLKFHIELTNSKGKTKLSSYRTKPMDHLVISNPFIRSVSLLIQSPFSSDPFEAVVPDIDILEPDTIDRRIKQFCTHGKNPHFYWKAVRTIPETLNSSNVNVCNKEVLGR